MRLAAPGRKYRFSMSARSSERARTSGRARPRHHDESGSR